MIIYFIIIKFMSCWIFILHMVKLINLWKIGWSWIRVVLQNCWRIGGTTELAIKSDRFNRHFFSTEALIVVFNFKVEREKVSTRVSNAKFVSLIMDGSTDVSVREQEMVYVRTCHAGVVATDFVQIVATPKADADGIMTSLQKAVTEGLQVSFQDIGRKLVGMGTDGAAVMVGCNNGVTTKVRETVAPTLVAIHCFAHRLELASKDVVKRHPRYGDFEQMLHDLFTFYKKRWRYSNISIFQNIYNNQLINLDKSSNRGALNPNIDYYKSNRSKFLNPRCQIVNPITFLSWVATWHAIAKLNNYLIV